MRATHKDRVPPTFQIPKRDPGCVCLSVIRWVSAWCLARFSLGGTDSIHSPDNGPEILSGEVVGGGLGAVEDSQVSAEERINKPGEV